MYVGLCDAHRFVSNTSGSFKPEHGGITDYSLSAKVILNRVLSPFSAEDHPEPVLILPKELCKSGKRVQDKN